MKKLEAENKLLKTRITIRDNLIEKLEKIIKNKEEKIALMVRRGRGWIKS